MSKYTPSKRHPSGVSPSSCVAPQISSATHQSQWPSHVHARSTLAVLMKTPPLLPLSLSLTLFNNNLIANSTSTTLQQKHNCLSTTHAQLSLPPLSLSHSLSLIHSIIAIVLPCCRCWSSNGFKPISHPKFFFSFLTCTLPFHRSSPDFLLVLLCTTTILTWRLVPLQRRTWLLLWPHLPSQETVPGAERLIQPLQQAYLAIAT